MKKLLTASIVFFALCAIMLSMSCNNGNTNENIKDPVIITFETFGIIDIPSIITERGSEITLPILVIDNYEFGGWFYDENYSNICIDNIYINRDITLYAKFINSGYKYEISNLSHTIIEQIADYLMVISFTWDNPDDVNFSHVNFYWGYNDNEPINQSEQSENTLRHTFVKQNNAIISIVVKCVDKNGNLSKGIQYSLN